MVAVVLLALGFLGLAHALIDARRRSPRAASDPACRPAGALVVALAGGGVVLLLALTGGALALPGSTIAHALTPGLA